MPPITSIPPEQFERHLDILKEESVTVLPLAELIRQSKEEPERKIAAITFDDAYQSIYQTAFPLLRSRGLPFTIFVATEFVQDDHPLYLSWHQLREMADNGAHIANHTHSHAHLIRRLDNESKAQWRERVTAEITTAANRLRDNGFESGFFAYPYGEYNLELLGIVGSLGMTGFGQQSGAVGTASNRLILPRFPLAGVYVGERAFRDKIRSLAMPIEHPNMEPLVTDDFRPPLKMTFTDKHASINRLTCYGPGGLMPLAELDPMTIIATPEKPVTVGRSRYNCTLPAGAGRYYWFSQLWIRRNDDGSWYPEP